MRDFRDAKAMAHTLRESLTTKAINISHGESLELVSKMLGVADWNTLSALLQADRSGSGTPAVGSQTGTASYPAIPIRDLVPFPAATYPLFVGREKTVQALNQAFERQREVVIAIQRQSGVDEPGLDDVYEIGVLAQLLEVERLDDGTLKVLTQIRRRVAIRRFAGEGGAFRAEVADVSEGPIPEAFELIQRVANRFVSYAAPREIRLSQIWPPLEQTRDPGRVADIISSHMILPISEKHDLLATIDPVARLRRVYELMDSSGFSLSPALEVTRRRAFELANQRKHQYATLEHLLLALSDDADASAVMRACNAELGALRASLVGYLDDELKGIVTEQGGAPKPTAAFQRVAQRAATNALELGCSEITGANTLLAIFAETRSPAARLLGQHGVSRERVAELIAQGIGKTG